jgi:hypothetical protein
MFQIESLLATQLLKLKHKKFAGSGMIYATHDDLHDFAYAASPQELAEMTNMVINEVVSKRTETRKGGEFFLVSKDGKTFGLVSCSDVKDVLLGMLKEEV